MPTWTAADVELLRQLYAQPTPTRQGLLFAKRLARRLGRSTHAVWGKAKRLGLTRARIDSEAILVDLKRMKAARWTLRQMAKSLRMSIFCVKGHLRRLGIRQQGKHPRTVQEIGRQRATLKRTLQRLGVGSVGEMNAERKMEEADRRWPGAFSLAQCRVLDAMADGISSIRGLVERLRVGSKRVERLLQELRRLDMVTVRRMATKREGNRGGTASVYELAPWVVRGKQNGAGVVNPAPASMKRQPTNLQEKAGVM